MKPTEVTLFGCKLEADESIPEDVMRMNPKTLSLVTSVAFSMALAKETKMAVEIKGPEAQA